MKKEDVDAFLMKLAREEDRFSDIVITPGYPCQYIVDGVVRPTPVQMLADDLGATDTRGIADALIAGDQRLLADLKVRGSCDLSHQTPDTHRYRVNIFSRRGAIGIIMRKLDEAIPTIEGLGLPACFFRMAAEKNGLVLFTGSTGTGKSTSLAAIINEINSREALHIVTLEDPIEYIHPRKMSTINQRELGMDFVSFGDGLRSALRQAPHVILVGEIRDRETADVALDAAETGHLVLSTLHTTTAGHTISRLLGMFSIEEERQIRHRLADSLRWVVGQKLLPRKGGGQVAVFDILRNTLAVREIILQGESEGKNLCAVMRSGSAFHMQTFDQHAIRLFEEGAITEETLLTYATNRWEARILLDRIKRQKGERTSDIVGLEIDHDYMPRRVVAGSKSR